MESLLSLLLNGSSSVSNRSASLASFESSACVAELRDHPSHHIWQQFRLEDLYCNAVKFVTLWETTANDVVKLL